MCPIVPTFTCGLLRSNFSFAMFSYQIPPCLNPCTTLQKPFLSRCGSAIQKLFGGPNHPGLIRTGPPAALTIVFLQTLCNVGRDSDVTLTCLKTAQNIQPVLQTLEPLTRIELMTF